MLTFLSTRAYATVCLLVIVPVLAQADVASDPLVLQIDDSCVAIGAQLAAAAPAAWPCSTLADEAATAACRQKLVEAVTKPVAEALSDRTREQQAELYAAWAEESRSEEIPLLSGLGAQLTALVVEAREALAAEAEARLAKIDLSKSSAQAEVKAAWQELAADAGADFVRECRAALVPAAFQTAALGALRSGPEMAYAKDLTKTDGFSQLVRCQWRRLAGEADRLDCTPGLRINGEDASAILIQAPTGDEDFRLAWVQVITAEEGFRPISTNAPLTCPQHGQGSTDSRKLSCDEICFGQPPGVPACGASAEVYPPLQTVSISVHKPRWFSTSYGCRFGTRGCAFRRLRGLPGPEPQLRREKLSLVLDGKSPYVVVHAVDGKGRVASGTVLVGYERWRVETGGFLAFSPLVDEELVRVQVGPDGTAIIDDNEVQVGQQQVAVEKVRDADDWTQETGIFVNFIPTNYESVGLGLGFATHDGGAPSIYLGPIARFRSFGHRGLGAVIGGIVMREVDRFPDFQPGVYDADSAFLEPDSHYDYDWFVGIQLGFSFGSISVPGDGNGQ